MNNQYHIVLSSLLILYMTISSFSAIADETEERWLVQVSPYTLHFSPSDEHRDVWMVGVEHQSAENWLLGGTYFKNSFGQPSWFWYGGYRWDGSGSLENFYAKLAGGVIIGYDEPYEDKIPINWDGVGLGALPSIGWQYKRFEAQLNLLGTAGLMMTLNFDISP